MSALAFSASVVPRAVAAPRRASRAARRAASAPVRASGAAYDEVFDGNTGQMVKTLSQSVETVSAGGLDWSYRLGVPEEGVEVRPNKVLLVHGAGLVGFTYSKLMKELQLKGYVCVAPDMPGHGDSSKPAPGGGFAYDAAAYQSALDAFVTETALDADGPVDLVVSGFFTSQVRSEARERSRRNRADGGEPSVAPGVHMSGSAIRIRARHETFLPCSRPAPPYLSPT